MRLAFYTILQNRVRFLVTVCGVAFAAFLMIFEASLFVGFVQAASRLINSTESDLWITPRGVGCFDFAATLTSRYREIANGIDGVVETSRISMALAQFRKPNGDHQTVALVGADPGVGKAFPVPYLNGMHGVVEPESLLVDESNVDGLQVAPVPAEVEINQRRARVSGVVRGFSSFLGTPYVFTSYADAARYVGLRPDDTMYILVRVAPGTSEAVKMALRARLPEADVWTRAEFSRRSQRYWIIQTGAGSAIITAAVLGFLIGLVVVSQTIYATTMENIEEFATLKALGASRWFVLRIVVLQALACGIVGCVAGIAATAPLVKTAQSFIPWVHTPWWVPVAMTGTALAMCSLAAVVSVRAAVAVEPARVFRA